MKSARGRNGSSVGAESHWRYSAWILPAYRFRVEALPPAIKWEAAQSFRRSKGREIGSAPRGDIGLAPLVKFGLTPSSQWDGAHEATEECALDEFAAGVRMARRERRA